MHKCSSQPRPERWKPQEITAGSAPTKKKINKEREREREEERRREKKESLHPGQEVEGKVHTRHNNGGDPKQSKKAGSKCAAGAGRLTSWGGGANISLGKRNYSYKGPCHLEDEERQKQEKIAKKKTMGRQGE